MPSYSKKQVIFGIGPIVFGLPMALLSLADRFSGSVGRNPIELGTAAVLLQVFIAVAVGFGAGCLLGWAWWKVMRGD